jgi:hypothetical protein
VDVVRSRVPVFVFVPHPVVRMAVSVDEVGRQHGGQGDPFSSPPESASGEHPATLRSPKRSRLVRTVRWMSSGGPLSCSGLKGGLVFERRVEELCVHVLEQDADLFPDSPAVTMA